MWLPPERKAASAASIEGWRRMLSSRSRTAGRIIRESFYDFAGEVCAVELRLRRRAFANLS